MVAMPVFFKRLKKNYIPAVVVTQLVVQSLQAPAMQGSNPVIGKIYIEHYFTVNCIEKTKIQK